MANDQVIEYPVIWLQAATCTGCSVSILNLHSPDIKNVLIDEILPGKHINLKFHATIMAGQGDSVIQILEETPKRNQDNYILVIEGAIPTKGEGIYGILGEKDGQPIPIASQVESLAKNSLAVIALGTCAAFGGIAAGKPNPSGCVGTSAFFKSRGINKPVINVPGCPPHPDWFMGTVVYFLLFGLPQPQDLDEYQRPKVFFGQLIHENCPRRAYFDEGKFARKFGEPGCLNELGCKGPVTHSDCPLRKWNNGVNWCIGAGSPCIGCCEPGFPDLLSPMYQKLTGENIPIIGKPKGG